MSALTKIQKLFPQVTKVVDSKKSVLINVTKQDNSAGRKKDFANCALAKACVRQKIAEHAIIGLTYSYLVVGNKAVRYKTSTGVGREIVSFDRSQKFQAGKNYRLSTVAKSNKLGHRATRKNGKKGGVNKTNRGLLKKPTVHRTSNVRKMASI